MSGSPKGRVIGSTAVRGRIPPTRREVTGTCAWCGRDTYRPRVLGFRCAGCDSDEIDWRDPLPPPAPAQHQVRDEHTPGSIAYSMLGGFVRPNRHGN
jgi:hypothetical protein